MNAATARPAERGAPLLAPDTSARDAAHALLGNRLSRRAFLAGLTGAGVCAPAAAALATALGAGAPGAGRSRELRNLTGGELMAEVLRDWRVQYVFGLGGSEEVGFLDALVDRPERLAVELNRALPADAIVVTELATSDPYVWRYLDFHQTAAGRVHVTSAGGCLGWGLGAAIGARIAAPDRCVALLVGDGSFQFGVQALWFAARYEVPVAIVIWNNVAYQANRAALHRYGGRAAATGKYIGCHLGAPEIDHVRIAAGYGVDGERVARPSALPAAITRCLGAVSGGRAYVLDVRIQRRGADSDWYGAFSVARRLPRQS